MKRAAENDILAKESEGGRGMKIELHARTEEHVRIYFEKSKAPEIRAVLPQKATSEEEAVENFRNTQKPGASSYGRTIYADGVYIGDVWCYGIRQEEEPDAMVSYCVFEKPYWNHGIATKALEYFLEELVVKFELKSIGAFSYAENCASIAVLQKNGFGVLERFVENGVESVYLQKTISE